VGPGGVGSAVSPVDYLPKHSRRRKARTVFSDAQLNGLEKRFDIQKYLSTPERIELASQLSLSETQASCQRQNRLQFITFLKVKSQKSKQYKFETLL